MIFDVPQSITVLNSGPCRSPGTGSAHITFAVDEKLGARFWGVPFCSGDIGCGDVAGVDRLRATALGARPPGLFVKNDFIPGWYLSTRRILMCLVRP